MKTSVIRYRVADFLKQYPPFNELSQEELLSLASSGRVVFHESEEYIFRKNQAKKPLLWVIQQGSVEIIDETADGNQLRDLLAEGDLLNAEAGDAPYPHSAKTTSDVILYTIDAPQFWQIADRNPRVGRYLAALSDSGREVTTESKALGRTTWLDTPGPTADFLRRHLLAEGPEITLREAALKMSRANREWIAIQNDAGEPLGLLTLNDIRNHTANGALADAPVVASPVAAVPPGLNTGDYFLSMVQNRTRFLAVTSDGSGNSPLEGIVTDSDLSLATGHNPALLLDRILKASSGEDWRILLQQANRILSSALAAPSNFEVCARMAAEFQNAMLEALIRQAELEEGASSISHCWLLFGRAARGESVVPFQPEIGLVYDAPFGTDSHKYFSVLLQRVVSYLTDCGLHAASDAILGDIPPCQSLTEWKETFQRRIDDPIGNAVHRTRTLFDFQPLSGDRNLAAELKRAVAAELRQSGVFVAIMANDTMSNLPPLTFFHGLVVELDGAQRETLDVESTALGPIADAARVFALAAGDLEITNTLARLKQAATAMPGHATVLQEAAQAFRVAAYQQTLAGFAGEAEIRPALLGRYDQRLLKTAFDAIQKLLEVSSGVFDVAA
jgi:CBS domain-containing protein